MAEFQLNKGKPAWKIRLPRIDGPPTDRPILVKKLTGISRLNNATVEAGTSASYYTTKAKKSTAHTLIITPDAKGALVFDNKQVIKFAVHFGKTVDSIGAGHMSASDQIIVQRT